MRERNVKLAKMVFESLLLEHPDKTFELIKKYFYNCLKGYGMAGLSIDSYWEEVKRKSRVKDRVIKCTVDVKLMYNELEIPIFKLTSYVDEWDRLDEEQKIEKVFEYLNNNKPLCSIRLIDIDGKKVHR